MQPGCQVATALRSLGFDGGQVGPALAVRLRSAVALAGGTPSWPASTLTSHRGDLALKGANGAGKTSLLRVIAGFFPLAAGEASVLGLDPTSDGRDLRRQVGLLGHRNGLYDDLSAEENVRFAAGRRAQKESATGPLSGSASRTGLPRSPSGSFQPDSAAG